MTFDLGAVNDQVPELHVQPHEEALAPRTARRDLQSRTLAAAHDALRAIGCPSILVGRNGPDGLRVLATNRPRRWTETYLARGLHKTSPIARHLVRQTRPYAWSEITVGRTLAPVERDVMEHARAHGLREGFVVPLRAEIGSTAFVSFAGPSLELTGPLRDRLGRIANALYAEIERTRPDIPRLSPREAEIIRWIADGKSDWQIGQILAISAKTVNYHVENVKRKFAVATRLQAVVRAVRCGYVKG